MKDCHVYQKYGRTYDRPWGHSCRDYGKIRVCVINIYVLNPPEEVTFDPFDGYILDSIIFNLPIRIVWSKVSKAFYRSMKTAKGSFLLSMLNNTLSNSSEMARSIVCCVLKPY